LTPRQYRCIRSSCSRFREIFKGASEGAGSGKAGRKRPPLLHSNFQSPPPVVHPLEAFASASLPGYRRAGAVRAARTPCLPRPSRAYFLHCLAAWFRGDGLRNQHRSGGPGLGARPHLTRTAVALLLAVRARHSLAWSRTTCPALFACPAPLFETLPGYWE